MKITEVKIKLVPRSDKLLAFASVTFNSSFVIRDIKIIQGKRGLFVAMPSRKITERCFSCGTKNHLQAAYCNHCGKQLPNTRLRTDERGRAKLHADIAHPINSRCRMELQKAILKGYRLELDRSRKPGYVPAILDGDVDEGPESYDEEVVESEEVENEPEPKGPLPPVTTPPKKDPPNGNPSTDDSNKNKLGDGGGFGLFG